MRAVGVKKLKAQLSSYLRQVRMGETVLVTDRDEVIAELCPPRAGVQVPAGDELEATLERMAADGLIVRARNRDRVSRWAPNSLGLPSGTAQALLDDLRSDRE